MNSCCPSSSRHTAHLGERVCICSGLAACRAACCGTDRTCCPSSGRQAARPNERVCSRSGLAVCRAACCGLDQSLLWRARVHPQRPCHLLCRLLRYRSDLLPLEHHATLASACALALAPPPAVPRAAAPSANAVAGAAATLPVWASACAFAAASPPAVPPGTAVIKLCCFSRNSHAACLGERVCVRSGLAACSAACWADRTCCISSSCRAARLGERVCLRPGCTPWRARVGSQRPRRLPCRLLRPDPLSSRRAAFLGERVCIFCGQAACCLPCRLLRPRSGFLPLEQPPRRPPWRTRVHSQRPCRLLCRLPRH